MSIHIELTPREEARLQAAAARDGVSAAECARRVLVEHLPAEGPQDRTLDLFAEWEREDATCDPEEIERRNREWEEFRNSMNSGRAAAGARLLYP